MQSNLTIANDNAPLGYNTPLGHNMSMGHNAPSNSTISVSKYSPVKSGVRIHLPKVPAPVQQQTSAQLAKNASYNKNNRQKHRHQKTGRFPVYVLLLLWVLAVAAIARFSGSPNDATLLGSNLAIAGGALGILSLALAAIARRRQAKISHSIGIAGACVCLAGLVWFYMQQSEIKISPEFMALGISASSLILARIWRTPFLLHISLLIMVGWSAYSFMNYQVSELAWLFPALWSVQMFLSLEFQIKRSISLSIFTGLLWICVNLFLLK